MGRRHEMPSLRSVEISVIGIAIVFCALLLSACGGKAAQPTPSRFQSLHSTVETNWDRDWPTVIRALEQMTQLQPDAAEWREKLYAAYIGDSASLLSLNKRNEALSRLHQARTLDPSRGVAQQRIQ